MAKKTDQATLDLIDQVRSKKAEVAKLATSAKHSWKTNCSFSTNRQDGMGTDKFHLNLRVAADISVLMHCAAIVVERHEAYQKAAEIMGVDAPPFTFCDYTQEEWLADIGARIKQLQLQTKAKSLEQLESRLDKIISPELKAQMEREAIAAELAK